ncbi:Mss4-like protein [Coniella lustricola]|uniref:Mss4-like protein n=1 Tax=Coniella lustricola TaxID=2025994 RepID=A0A2T3ABP9_9PEZI|nr:Mss4-like protein [Coniella lustricola]
MSSNTTEGPPPPKKRQTYEAGCHCGYIKFSVTVSPPLPETKPLRCNCSACRRFGYLLVYMVRKDVEWHGDSWTRLSRYQFNTKEKDQLFCGKCGASIGIDFRDSYAGNHPSMFGISVRTFNGIDLDALEYRTLNGVDEVQPAEDLSGKQYELDERKTTSSTREEAEQELAAAAAIA